MRNRMDILKIEYYRHRPEGKAEKALDKMLESIRMTTAYPARVPAKTTERLVTCRISAEGAGKRRELRRREPTLINLVYVTRNIRAGFRLFFCFLESVRSYDETFDH